MPLVFNKRIPKRQKFADIVKIVVFWAPINLIISNNIENEQNEQLKIFILLHAEA